MVGFLPQKLGSHQPVYDTHGRARQSLLQKKKPLYTTVTDHYALPICNLFVYTCRKCIPVPPPHPGAKKKEKKRDGREHVKVADESELQKVSPLSSEMDQQTAKLWKDQVAIHPGICLNNLRIVRLHCQKHTGRRKEVDTVPESRGKSSVLWLTPVTHSHTGWAQRQEGTMRNLGNRPSRRCKKAMHARRCRRRRRRSADWWDRCFTFSLAAILSRGYTNGAREEGGGTCGDAPSSNNLMATSGKGQMRGALTNHGWWCMLKRCNAS